MGLPALVPFRDRIAGTHRCHFAFPNAESPVGRGARLHRHACRPRDRHDPRRIRARCAATRRGDMVTCGRLDKLAQAANRLGVTASTVTGSDPALVYIPFSEESLSRGSCDYKGRINEGRLDFTSSSKNCLKVITLL